MATKGVVKGIVSNLVTVEVDGPVSQNEICFITVSGTPLMSEVIKVIGKNAYVQVFESTRGMRVGDSAEFLGSMLEVTLGPGMLSKNYDGLQNDLDKMDGVFLKRGSYTYALDEGRKWEFKPLAKEGETVTAGHWLGEVDENHQAHKIMVPFVMTGNYTLLSLAKAGSYTVDDTIAVLKDKEGNEHKVTMVQRWPVKKAITCYREKPRPFKLLETGVRIIDTLNPIVEGGTGFIPGPFGTGKTVLQHAISKQAEADIVIIAACGERANEVVEIFKEFPELIDSHTGRKLMERTIIIANTSNMPVASREASVYTAMTIAEYYRSMGLKVLLMADSTSRWAQALREMSNRLEELPGPDAFPMDLSAIVANFYARAGFVYLNNGSSGSVTFIGTVSPAGGNLKEPVTENTKKVARCFYALEQERADRKRYPAVNPIDSYSKYIEYPEFEEYISGHISHTWTEMVLNTKTRLQRGKEIAEQINILGDDGVPVDYHVTFWKAELIDFVILQQDAFDDIDCNTPLERQQFMLTEVVKLCEAEYDFEDFSQVSEYFKRVINVFKQMNYSEYKSADFDKFYSQLQSVVAERIKK
ncbi:ATP synthase subunit A [Porphyromonas crevioricanis]|uniref:V-type ATP synthase alpha chain n=2 Tax=Porphyromonas crevioricanis TaxID=393921 RepID=A0A0A2G0K6_9PORP|nr:V-type ATP synthase subunit A [Porphyromonas crevioricanis]KGN90737.1 ATP synthase subunit A [Porphyromonas crevioricanis]KGN94019.1 ATP synthase subunit A [Porphyromonas crevioricanis]SJZ61864.1 V/A-type H+-transporting ATPase subunit A [Porphyromonas crevioricanis]SQH72844.1 V-type sodium ATPase catalytic subunit A [Porphyromonas crevioricanis]GAD06049.1 V-type ATP synthase subunit A [Porphyromonas crevioricanis JCM 15906]